MASQREITGRNQAQHTNKLVAHNERRNGVGNKEGEVTRTEFDAGNDGLHVPLTCENHPELRWSCKRIAITFDSEGVGRYNQSRNIFYKGEGPECDCPSSKLRLIIEEN